MYYTLAAIRKTTSGLGCGIIHLLLIAKDHFWTGLWYHTLAADWERPLQEWAMGLSTFCWL
jgi:hypothetical protein